jgi:hypothetical protein
VLHPRYKPLVERVLDQIDHDEKRVALWNAVADAIDLVCDEPGSAQARHERVDFPERGMVLFKVPIRTRDEDWMLLWHQYEDEAVFEYLGPEF